MEKIGIIAGEDRLPKIVIDYCINNNIEPFIIKISSQSDANYQDYSNVIFVKIGAVGKAVSYLNRHQVKNLLIVGRISRPDNIFKTKVDLKGGKLLAKLAMNKIFGDNNLLSSIKDFLINEGFELLSLNKFMPDDLFFKPGLASKTKLSDNDSDNIKLGRDLIEMLSEFDVGQSVIVEGKRIIAIEAAEGTDGMLARAANLVKFEGCLVKTTKTNQITEIDLPCIGLETVKNALTAKVKVIAVQASGTIIIDKEQVLEFINQKKMKLVAF